MSGNILFLLGSLTPLFLGVYAQVVLRRRRREEISMTPDGPRVVQRDGVFYFEEEDAP